MLLWQAFFTALGGPQETFSWGDETTRLAPTMEGIWGFSDTPTPELAEEAKALLMSWLAGVPGCGPPSKIGTSPPECQKIDLIFDAQETLALVAASKARKVSVIFAVHSAFALAKAEHATDETKGKDYVSLAQFNLRDYLGSPYNTAAYATNVYYTSIPIITPVGSFDEIAENMNDLYSGAIAKNPKMCELNGHYLRAFFAIAQTPEFLEGPVPGDALVSSLGVGERYLKRDYNGVKVSNLRFAVDVVMGLSIVFLYTFEDHLRLTYCYNEGFQSGLDVQAILDSTADILKHELGF
ncbi:hypothetical protein MMC10_008065 [Thelotrema lepadinum]|nr:hypothetical protein [Thelotrema lepadinum]